MFGLFKKSLLEQARTVVVRCIEDLNFPPHVRDVGLYMPNSGTVQALVDASKRSRRTPYDLALMLVDAGYMERCGATDRGALAQAMEMMPTIDPDDMLAELGDAGRARHDRLLTRVYEVALLHFTEIVPQCGSVGAAVKGALGKLARPI